MRRTISFLLIVSALAANARQISPEEAQSIASEFFNPGLTLKANKSPRCAVQATHSGESQSEPQPYYIYNATDNAGFVIISGDTRAKKILGYSDSGSLDFGNMPPQLDTMLEQYAKRVAALPESIQQDASWSASYTHNEEGGVLLETANWDQLHPYNLMTPGNCVTGCIPTAVAIIMRYHKWPETGLGHTSYESNGHTVSFNFDNSHFDWDLMPLDYVEGQYTDEQALEVSKAMYAAGSAVRAMYDTDETCANMPAYGMYRFLKYDIPKRDVVIQDALELCLNKFIQTVKSEVLANRPMLLDVHMYGYVDHMIVADGYDSQNNVHLNYGWGGSGNGFYNPEIIINTTRYIYSNIKPDRNATSDREEILPDDGALSNSNDGGALKSGLVVLGEIKPNEEFGFVYHIAFQPASLTNLKLGLLHMSSQGIIKDVLWNENLDLTIYNGDVSGQSWTSITKEIADDDRVTLAYKKEDTDEWHIIKDTPNAKASVCTNAQDQDFLHFSVVSEPGVNIEVGSNAIIEDQKDSWNYSGKIKKCFFNLSAAVNESFMLGHFTLHENIGCATISINGIEIGQIEHNYLNNVPFVETKISDISNLIPYLPESIVIEVKKYLYDDMLALEKHVEEAGTLNQLFRLDEARYTRSLALSGQIDVNDLKFVEDNCPFLQILDMSKADITDGVLPCSAYVKSTKMLQQIKLPRNLTKIESEAFMGENGHGGIRIVYIPDGVNEIGERAFMLGEISSVVMANPKPINVQNLQDAPFRFASAIYVPKGSKLEYENAGWGQYWNGVFFDRKVIEYEGDFIPIDSISFSQEITTMKIGEKLSVNPVIYPNNSTEQWNGFIKVNDLGCGIQLSDNNCIEATEESSNLITVNHSNLYAHMLVNVIPYVSSIILNETDATLDKGQTIQLSATILPEGADKALQWTSSNEAVATVDQSGLVTAISRGTAVITAISTDGSDILATCDITVVEYSGIEDIVIDGDEDVKIFNISGLLLFEGKYSDVKLDEGIYIITTKDGRYKRLIK